jgi:hypothetical protein
MTDTKTQLGKLYDDLGCKFIGKKDAATVNKKKSLRRLVAEAINSTCFSIGPSAYGMNGDDAEEKFMTTMEYGSRIVALKRADAVIGIVRRADNKAEMPIIGHPYEDAVKAIRFVVEITPGDDSDSFLRLWLHGDWPEIDRDWPEWKAFVEDGE